MESENYGQLCAEFYDISKPSACEKEVAFYEKFIQKSSGPILEAMVGSGRLLIPLLKKGYQIDGVDKSKAMLERATKRCEKEKLFVNLYHQPLEALALPKKYALIFVAVGSFQLIHDRNEALAVLKKLRDHLLPGGILLLDTFVPWDFIKESIESDHLLATPKKSQSVRRVFLSDGSEIVLSICHTLYPNEQLELSDCIYEKKLDGKLLKKEEEPLFVRWYYRLEMELLLEKAGFKVEKIFDESFAHNPSAVIFQCVTQ